MTVIDEGNDNLFEVRSALSAAIVKSAYFWQMATDERGVIQIFNVGAEAMLGYDALEVVNRITPADMSDPGELIKRAAELSAELGTPIEPGFEALVYKAKRGIEDNYELTYVRKDGSRFPAIVSVTALRDAGSEIIGYLLIGTDNTEAKSRSALSDAIVKSAYFWQMATDERGVIQIFNVGAEAMLGYDALEVVNRITPADMSDPGELIKRAAELSAELGTPIEPGFETLVYKAKRGIEDTYELTYVRKDGSRFPAIVSVTALRDAGSEIIGYLLIGTDNTEAKSRSALSDAIVKSEYFWQMATDERGVIQIFNVGAEAMLGYDALEVVNRITPADMSDPGELIKRAAELSAELGTPIEPGFEALVYKAKRGIEDTYELTYVRKDGSRFPAIVSVTALRDAGSEIIGYLLIGTDNTVGKQVEAAQALLDQQLRDQQFYTRSLIESNIDALMTTDPQGTITDVNQQMMTLTECSREELIGAPFRDFFTDPARADAGIARVLAEYKVSDYELTVRARNGAETFVSYNAATFHDRDGKLQGVFAAARDVTEARQASQYARSLLEAALDPLVTISAEGKIGDVNEATIKVTGVPREELIGTDFSGYFTDPDKANEGYQQVFAQGAVTDYPLTLRHRNETLTQVLYNASVYRDTGGNVLGVFAAARDVTEQRGFETQMLAKNVELEHASRMKSEFLATMSHELRTPLNSVIGFSEALKDGLLGELTASQREYIGDIFTSGQHLLSLINDILDLSKVEAGMMNLELEPVDVGPLLSGALSIVREKASAHEISLDLDLADHLGVSHLDMRKTKQVVYNLLSNAVKFSSQGGRVTLRARPVPRRVVGTLEGRWPVRSFELAPSGFAEFLEIRVTDNGIGITQENMAKLFQAFTQIDSTLARQFEGTGLGLAMVKQMTELMGGTVAMASKLGEGSCFAAWIPLRVESSAEPASADPEDVVVEVWPVPEASKRLALVVEDDDNAAELVRLFLEVDGFSVLCASSAEEALEMAPHHNFDLITLDIQLPGMDGWEFLSAVREDTALSKVPVVIISGATSGQPLVLSGGAAAVLAKPISRFALKEALKGLGFDEQQRQVSTVLVVDDDPLAVEEIAAFLPAPAYVTLRAYGGQEAIVLARRMRPDLILLDLMMPDVNGHDVVHALRSEPQTAGIPILVVTAQHVTARDQEILDLDPDRTIRIFDKAGVSHSEFLAEVRRALQRG